MAGRSAVAGLASPPSEIIRPAPESKVVGSALEIRYGLIGSLLLTMPAWWLDWRYALLPGVLLPMIALVAWLANQRWIRNVRRSLVDVLWRAWSPVLTAPEASGYRALQPATQ